MKRITEKYDYYKIWYLNDLVLEKKNFKFFYLGPLKMHFLYNLVLQNQVTTATNII